MTPNETRLFEALEVLAAHCPWEAVDIWVQRAPTGQIEFTAYARGVDRVGLGSAFGSGLTPHEAVERLKHDYPDRNIEARCRDRIAKLHVEIDRLRSLQFALPPYRPTAQIGVPHPENILRAPGENFTVNVQAEEVPF